MSRSASRLPRTLAALGLAGLGVTGLVAVGLGVGVAFLASPTGNRFLTERVRSAGQDAMVVGTFRLDALRTDVFRDASVRGLVIEDESGRPVVAVDRLSLDWRPRGLLEGEIQLGQVHAEGVRLELTTLPDGNIDLLALFGVPPTDPAEPAQPFTGIGIDLEARDVRLDDVVVRMTEAGGAESLALTGSLSGPVRVQGRDVRLPAITLDAALAAPVALPLHAQGGVGLVGGALELRGVELATEHSALSLDGVIARVETAPALGLDIQAHPLGSADIAGIAGRPVLRDDLEVEGRIHGGLEALRLDARVDGGDAGRVHFGAMAGLTSTPMPWTLDARTDALALDALLVDVPEPVRLAGVYRVGAVGTDWPKGLDATVYVAAGEQVLWGEAVASTRLEAQVSGGVVRVQTFEAEHAAGRLFAEGQVDIPGQTAGLDVTANVPTLRRLERLGAPPMSGSARFRGPVDLAWGGDAVTVDARGGLGLTALDVQGVQVARVSGPASLSLVGEHFELDGELAVDGLQTAGLAVERMALDLELGWDPQSGARAMVDLEAHDVSVGDGAVKVSEVVGVVSGTAPPDGAPAATADLDVANLLLGPAEVEAEGGPVDAVLVGDSVLVEFDLARRARPFFAGRVRGDLGLQEWVADNLVVAPVAERPFVADGPVEFSLRDGGFRDLDGRLASDSGDLTVRGDLVPPGRGASDLSLRVEHLDLVAVAAIYDLYRPPVKGLRLRGLSGDLDMAVKLTGDDAYDVDVSLMVEGLHAPPGVGAEIKDLDLQLGVAGALGRPHVTLRAAHDDELLADVRGDIPLLWEGSVPSLDCDAPVDLDAILAPGDIGRLHARMPDIPDADLLGSASVSASGPLCDPAVRLVSTWSMPVGPSGEWVQVEFDAERSGPALQVWGALEEGLARRVTLEGGAVTTASTTLSGLLAGEGGLDPARPESWIGDVDLRLVPLGVPLTRLVELAGGDTVIQGRLQGGISLTGPVQQPTMTGALLVDGGRIGSVPVSEARLMVLPAGDAGYTIDGRLGFGRDNALGDLSIHGDVPLRLDIDADPDELLATRGLALSIDGVGVPLSVLEGVSSDIEAASGRLTIGGFVSGSLQDPMPNFVVGVRDGLLVHRALGVRYSDMELDLRANGHRLELARLSLATTERTARQVGKRVIGSAQPGTLTATGGASIGAGGVEDLEIALEAENLWLSNRPEARFRVNGGLDVVGAWPDLSVGGDVEMVEGVLNLDERVFMNSRDLALDPKITVLRPQGVGGGAAQDEGSPFEDLDLDVHLDLHRGLRFRAAVPMDDTMGREVTALSTVRLDAGLASPDLWIQTKDGELVVHGQVELRDGQLTLVGSKFELATDKDNTLNFISDDYLEPTLDITAERGTRSYGTVEAHVTGSPSAPMVAFENPDYPDETDVMSILLFGKPAAELSDSEGQAGAGMLSAAIGMMARNSLSRALGGGNLRTEIAIDGDSFRVGRPLSDRVFATFEYLTQSEEDEGTFEVTLEWLISRRLYAEVAGGDGGNSADLYWRWRF